MAKPPKTPPQDEAQKPTEKTEKLREEEAHPAETLKEMTENEKGLPPGSKTSWN